MMNQNNYKQKNKNQHYLNNKNNKIIQYNQKLNKKKKKVKKN